MSNTSFRSGVVYAALAYLIWGMLPVYWKTLSAIPPLHILGFRIIFSLLLIACVLFALKRTSWTKFYKDKKSALYLLLAALFISCNWGLYIWAVNSGHAIEVSLGYYINPLISIVLGLYFFREKLNRLQILAFILAFTGVAILTVLTGKLPWISLALALTFGIYGLLKKKIGLPALESLGAETLLAAPLGLLLLLAPFGPDPAAGLAALSYIPELPLHTLVLLFLSGFMTSLPLYLFSKGTKILPLSTLGFIQFISPTLTFLSGFFIFRESFPPRNFVAFGFIWSSVIIYIISLYSGKRRES